MDVFDNQILAFLAIATVSATVIGIIQLITSEFMGFQRKQEVAQVAEQLGLEFENDQLRSQELVHQRYSDFGLVLNHTAATFKNLAVSRTDHLKLSLFDYGYCSENRPSKSACTPNTFQTILAIEIPQFEFANSFQLKANGQQVVGMTKHDVPQELVDLMDLMDLINANQQYCFEGIGNILWVYEENRLQEVQAYPELLQLGHSVYRALAG